MVRLLLFIGRRLVVLAGLLLVLSLAIFSLLALAPGSAERALLGTQPATPQTLAAIRAQYHLDQPFLEQYWLWLRGALHFDFGQSIQNQQNVSDLITQRMGVSLKLIGFAFAISIVFGLFFGILAAIRERSLLDRAIVSGMIVGVSAPAFVTGIILLYIFGVELQWFPVAAGNSGGFRAFVLPAFALAIGLMALITRVARASMLRELGRDHITFARARGLSYSRVLLVHGVRNALIPVVTSAGLVFSLMLGGSLLIETVFSLSGVGSLLVTSTLTHDYPIPVGKTVLPTGRFLIHLATHLTYHLGQADMHRRVVTGQSNGLGTVGVPPLADPVLS